jgi:hypothetical protein
MTEARTPDLRGEREVTVNHCVRECRVIPVDLYDSCAFYHYPGTRACGCTGRPAFPTPSLGAEVSWHTPGARFAPRDRECVF